MFEGNFELMRSRMREFALVASFKLFNAPRFYLTVFIKSPKALENI